MKVWLISEKIFKLMVSLSTRRLQQVLSCVAENLAPVPARSFK
jgi:hypothetical protein